MKKDKFKSDVIFRHFRGDIIALFPHMPYNYDGDVTSYQHMGQHSNADYSWVIYNSKPIHNPENLDLYSELNSLGYNLNIGKKQNYSKYLVELRHIRKTA